MVKKILSASLISAMFIFSGCGSTDSEGVDRLSSQQELDAGNYASTISKLESKANKTDEDNMVLASAYMGEAGFGFSDNIAMIGDAASQNTDTFSSFANKVQANKKPDSLDNIQKAIDAYNAVGTPTSKAPSYRAVSQTTVSTGDKDLFLGLAYITKATLVLSYLGDVSKLQSQDTNNELVASGCAIAKVYDNETLNDCNSPYTQTIDINGTTYIKMTITLKNANGVSYRLANASYDKVILTDYNDSSLTPISIGSEPAEIQDVLVKTLNDAFDYLLRIAPNDVQKDINAFKAEITGDANVSVTTLNISQYISNNN